MSGSRLGAPSLVAALSGLGLILLAGCGGSSPAASSSAPASAAASTPAATSTAAPSPVATSNSACPPAAKVSAAAGVTYLTPTATTASGALYCTYKTNTKTVLVISTQKATYPASALKQVAASTAKSQPTLKISPVSGLGDAAYLFTSQASPGKVQGSELLAEAGSTEYILVGSGSIGNITAVAHLAIGS